MEKLPEIIGLAGTNGAGKDTLGDLRVIREGARKVSLSDILRAEADKRGLSHERENLSAISTEWGRKLGAGALSAMTILNFKETQKDGEGISIVSVRRPDEANVIRSEGGLMIWIDADREMRYQRILQGSRGRVTDTKTFEQFCAEEDAEMYPGVDDPFIPNMSKVRDNADLHILNEFDTREEFEAHLIDRFSL